MHYKAFVIRNYRAITGPLRIDVEKSSLNPIVGINESGKTTILHAITAFDCWNDTLNDRGRHLKDVDNLYRTSSAPATVEAEIEVPTQEFKRIIAEAAKDPENAGMKSDLEKLSRRRSIPTRLLISRNLKTREYSIQPNCFGNSKLTDRVAREVISNLPYILYFDDFRDKIPERIEIPNDAAAGGLGWLGIIEQLFHQTDRTFNVYRLPHLEERARKTVLAKVQRKLNETLTKEWQTFRLDDRDALKVSIDFQQVLEQAPQTPPKPPLPGPTTATPKPSVAAPVESSTKNFIKLDVVEKDSRGDEHFFFISDRSKGFYWFFNFVMKLEFNPKYVSREAHAIYLLDEPGSYLHAFAQRKLCQKLRQISERNWVAFCTHSHYLLDPETIPVNRIMVADKDQDGDVRLIPITSYPSSATEKRSALQPVVDALQIKPFGLDLISGNKTVIAEGIYDYFCLEMFREGRSLSILPSVGADSIKFFISLMIAWQIEFRAIWDNDPEGRKKRDEAADYFGEEIAKLNLKLLPFGSGESRYIMQNLFAGEELASVRQQLGLDAKCSFERTIHTLFYHPGRRELVKNLTSTKRNFDALFESLGFA